MKQEADKREGVWITPRSFFEPIQRTYLLEIDAAADADNAMLRRFWDVATDAFKQDWRGLRVWCNPPYGRSEIYRWVERCATGGASIVVALLPARTDTRWFHDFICHNPNADVHYLKGRIKFSGQPGAGKFPSMVVVFRAAITLPAPSSARSA